MAETVFKFEFEDTTQAQVSDGKENTPAPKPKKPPQAPRQQPGEEKESSDRLKPIRPLLDEVGNLPTIGRAIHAAVEFFDKIAKLFEDAQKQQRSVQPSTVDLIDTANANTKVAADEVKTGALFPKAASPITPAPSARGQAIDAEREAIDKPSLDLPERKPVAEYPSQRRAKAIADRENARLLAEIDDAITRAQEARRPVSLDDEPVRKSPAPKAPTAAAPPKAPKSPVFSTPSSGSAAASPAASAASSAAPAGAAASVLAGATAIAAGAVIVVGALKAAADAAQAFGTRLIERAKALEGFSPDLARSSAQQRINDVRANLRAGQDFGGNLSRVNDASGEIKRGLTRIADIISDELLNKMLPLIEAAADGIESIAEYEDEIRFATKATVEALKATIPGAQAAVQFVEVARQINANTKVAADEVKNGNWQRFFREQPDLELNEVSDGIAGLDRKAVQFAGLGGAELP